MLADVEGGGGVVIKDGLFEPWQIVPGVPDVLWKAMAAVLRPGEIPCNSSRDVYPQIRGPL